MREVAAVKVGPMPPSPTDTRLNAGEEMDPTREQKRETDRFPYPPTHGTPWGGKDMRIAKAMALLLVWGIGAPALAQVDLDAYLKRDRYERMKISPTGDYMAVTVPLEDRTALAILRLSDKTITAKAIAGENSLVDDFWWANDERVVVAMAQRLGSRDAPYATGELHAVNADGTRPMLLASPKGIPDEGLGIGGTIRMTTEAAVFLIDPLANDERNVLVAAMQPTEDPQTHVVKLDIYNRRRTAVASAPVRSASFTADASGEVRFARGSGNDNVSKLYYRDSRGEDWRLVNDEAESGLVEHALGFSQDGKTAYLQGEVAGGPDAIFAYDPATGQRKELLRDPTVDPWRVIHRLDAYEPAGALYMSDRVRSRFFDEASPTARLYRSLEKAFPNEAVVVTSTTTDGSKAVVQVWSDRNNGDFYVFDTVKKSAVAVHNRREWFDPARVPPTRAMELKSRDGLTLHGYLTLPPGKDKNLPLVVLPHGGPFGIFDGWEFDDDSQMLAEAGYAVLRLNYRGSGNYGRDYHEAGARQWGKAMQDDLTDATRWAIAQQIADPSRICLYGASYGGYAALMGVAREPALYALRGGLRWRLRPGAEIQGRCVPQPLGQDLGIRLAGRARYPGCGVAGKPGRAGQGAGIPGRRRQGRTRADRAHEKDGKSLAGRGRAGGNAVFPQRGPWLLHRRAPARILHAATRVPVQTPGWRHREVIEHPWRKNDPATG